MDFRDIKEFIKDTFVYIAIFFFVIGLEIKREIEAQLSMREYSAY